MFLFVHGLLVLGFRVLFLDLLGVCGVCVCVCGGGGGGGIPTMVIPSTQKS